MTRRRTTRTSYRATTMMTTTTSWIGDSGRLRLRLLRRPSLILVHQLDILPTSMVIHNSTIFTKTNTLLFYRHCWVIWNDFPVSPRIQMERSLWIVILIMHHRTKMRLLVITNVEELMGIFHRYYNAAQYSTRMEKHRASPLNRCCNHSYGSTPCTPHSVSLITLMTYFPPRSHSRMSMETTSAQRLIF